jgi:hypothetical protein
MQHVWGRGKVCKVFWWGNVTERDHLEDPGIHEKNSIKMYLQKMGWGE